MRPRTAVIAALFVTILSLAACTTPSPPGGAGADPHRSVPERDGGNGGGGMM